MSRRWSITVFAFVIGLGLYAWSPLWWMPPRVLVTPWLYLAGLFMWVPLALWAGIRAREQAARRGAALVLVGLLLSCGLCGALRPYSTYSLLTLSLPFDFNSFACDDTPHPIDGTDIYTCELNSFDYRVDYEFQAPQGWPIGRLTRLDVDDFSDPND